MLYFVLLEILSKTIHIYVSFTSLGLNQFEAVQLFQKMEIIHSADKLVSSLLEDVKFNEQGVIFCGRSLVKICPLN